MKYNSKISITERSHNIIHKIIDILFLYYVRKYDKITTKKTQALEACDKVINGIEDGFISVVSALLLCKKIARLVNDEEGQELLGYEYGGYPRGSNGYILHNAWEIAARHGRSYQAEDEDGKKKKVIFIELC